MENLNLKGLEYFNVIDLDLLEKTTIDKIIDKHDIDLLVKAMLSFRNGVKRKTIDGNNAFVHCEKVNDKNNIEILDTNTLITYKIVFDDEKQSGTTINITDSRYVDLSILTRENFTKIKLNDSILVLKRNENGYSYYKKGFGGIRVKGKYKRAMVKIKDKESISQEL